MTPPPQPPGFTRTRQSGHWEYTRDGGLALDVHDDGHIELWDFNWTAQEMAAVLAHHLHESPPPRDESQPLSTEPPRREGIDAKGHAAVVECMKRWSASTEPPKAEPTTGDPRAAIAEAMRAEAKEHDGKFRGHKEDGDDVWAAEEYIAAKTLTKWADRIASWPLPPGTADVPRALELLREGVDDGRHLLKFVHAAIAALEGAK